jgi:hypothetical protein
MISLVLKNFSKVWKGGVLYRTTGVILSELDSSSVRQGDLFGESKDALRFETIHKQIDNIEEKFGRKVVYLGSTHRAINQKEKGTSSDDLDRNLLFL